MEEVRRRTSLLSGGGRVPPPTGARSSPQPRGSAAFRPSQTPSYSSDMGWSPPQGSTFSTFSGTGGGGGSGFAHHPLHSEAPTDPLFASAGLGAGHTSESRGSYDSRGNYFNEDLLLARAQGSASGGAGSTGFDPLEGVREGDGSQGARHDPWGGDALSGTAGNLLNTARWVGSDLDFGFVRD